MARELIALVGGLALAACGGGDASDDDDDIVAGDGDADADGDTDADTDSDGDGDADADADSDTDSDGDVDLPGVGTTWTEPTEVDMEVACETSPCDGPELRLAGAESRGRCAAGEGWTATMVVANCGHSATLADTVLALYYGAAGVDPTQEGTLLTAGRIPSGLAGRQAVAVHFSLTDEEWALAAAPQGYYEIDPDDVIAECFEEPNGDAYPVTYSCNER